jgi:choline dehydrogenase-like flavoprotein
MLKAHVEQVPNPDNRITLSPTRDRFGLPRARLSWRVHPEELRTLAAVTAAVGDEFHRLGFGRMQVASWLKEGPDVAQPHLEDTYHHAGTTRMASTPRAGVVDPNGRVFGVENLYIAGGSVFPTSSYANPTLTIVAMAIRLADWLKRQHTTSVVAPVDEPAPALADV